MQEISTTKSELPPRYPESEGRRISECLEILHFMKWPLRVVPDDDKKRKHGLISFFILFVYL